MNIIMELKEVRDYVYRVSRATHGADRMDFADYDLLERIDNLISVTTDLLNTINRTLEELDVGGEQSRAFAGVISALRTAKNEAAGKGRD